MTSSPKKRAVLFDHDGGYDDLLSLMMVLAMPHIDLRGVVVTPADCFLRPAVSASFKVLRFFNRLEIELSEGGLYGVNPFPRAWRAHPYAVDALPILNEIKPVEPKTQVDDNKGEASKPPAFSEYLRPEYSLLKSLEQGYPGPQDPFLNLQKQIQAKLLVEADPMISLSPPDAVRQQIRRSFEQILRQENVILSQAEQNRLFEAILTAVQDQLPGRLPAPVSEPGHEFLARKLREADTPVTVLITGPVSNLAAALHAEPDLAAKVEEVVWMGGALHVPGNVRDYEHDGTAEWNAYWDPPATHGLWQSEVPITLFPLDATNNVPVTMHFLHRLAQQRRYPLSDLAGQCWALTVGTTPAHEYIYYMWDTLTTGYLGGSQFMTFRQAQTRAIPSGPSAGRIEEVSEGGKTIRVAKTVDVPGFYDYLLELFRR